VVSSSSFFHLLYGAVIVLGTLAVTTVVSLGPQAGLGPSLLAGGLSAAFLAVLVFAAWRDPVTLARPFIVVGLFGTVLSLIGVANGQRLSEIPAFWLSLAILVLSTTTLTLVVLAAIYRPLVVECFNPGFLAAMGVRGSVYHYLFLALAVLNMVAGFQALGTLMALGLILLPAVASSFWAREVWSMTVVAAPMAFASAAIGLLVSFHAGLPSGPVIVLFASLFFLGSLLFGSRASVRARLSHPVHLRG